MKALSRLLIFGFAIFGAVYRTFPRKRTKRGLLIAHNLLLGDTLMLTPLMKRAHLKAPHQPKFILCRAPFEDLVASNGLGFKAVVFNLRSPLITWKLLVTLFGVVDKVLVVGDNRYGWLGLAAGAKEIIGELPEEKSWKKLPLTHWVSFMPVEKKPWSDQVAHSFFPDQKAFSEPTDWPQLDSRNGHTLYQTRRQKVFVHLGASSPLRYWKADYWRDVISNLLEENLDVTLSVGPGERHLLTPLKGLGVKNVISGTMTLLQVGKQISDHDLIICVDTGIAHLAKITHRKCVVIYGPGDPNLHGPGDYWGEALQYPVRFSGMPCRNETNVFKRPVHWVSRCSKSLLECRTPGECMNAVTPANVIRRVRAALKIGRANGLD